jgi:ComF family protein
MNLLRSLLDLLFPPICFSCSTRLENHWQLLCSSCIAELTRRKNVCTVCGNILENRQCKYCSSNQWYFDKVVSLFDFNKVAQDLIHDFKYNDMIRIAEFFSQYFNKYLTENEPFDLIDMVIPVPIHNVRKRSRGYNQAELISSKIAEFLEIQHLPRLVIRNKYTSTQTNLNRNERNKNVASAFKLKTGIHLKDKNILLVDDVFTTGSTVNSISRLLKENGGCKVFVLTISHA